MRLGLAKIQRRLGGRPLARADDRAGWELVAVARYWATLNRDRSKWP